MRITPARPSLQHLLSPILRPLPRRLISLSSSSQSQNRIYDSIRYPNDLHTLLALHASFRRSLLTLWLHTHDTSSLRASSLLRSLLTDGVGETHGGVGYVEVQLDAPTIEDLGVVFRINEIPTLMAFSRGEAQFGSRVETSGKGGLGDRAFLSGWVEREAARRGEGGGEKGWLG